MKILRKVGNIYLGLGLANESFDPKNCNDGFTANNSGVGFYNGNWALPINIYNEKMVEVIF